MARYLLAVDGGGSSSEFLIANEAGDELLRFCVGSTSMKSVGAKTAAANIVNGVRQLLAYLETQGDEDAEVYGLWGLTGCDSNSDQQEYESMLVRAGLDLAYHRVVNDSLLALRACVPAGPGIVLIAGTGSICVGVGASGEMVRLGGWGYQVSDLGSGTWVGSQLLGEALLYDDGCRENDPVFESVYQFAGCRKGELGAAAALLSGANQFAAFARLVLDSPDSPTCIRIMNQAADYLAGYVRATAERLYCGEAWYPVVLAGGLFRSDAFADAVSERLDHRARVVRLDVSPVQGGINLLLGA